MKKIFLIILGSILFLSLNSCCTLEYKETQLHKQRIAEIYRERERDAAEDGREADRAAAERARREVEDDPARTAMAIKITTYGNLSDIKMSNKYDDYYIPTDYKQVSNKALSDKHYSEISGSFGGGVGVGVDIPISEKFGVAPAVQFLGSKDIKQIQMPILARYQFADKFNAYAGPNIGFLVGAPEGLNTFNFGLDLGISYDISDNILVEARYDWGITDLADDSFSSFKVNNFMLGVGYRFKKKK